MQAKQTSTKMLVKEAVFIQGFHLSCQSYFCLFPAMYFMPQEYAGVLAAPCTHPWLHVVFLLSFSSSQNTRPPLRLLPSSSVSVSTHPSTCPSGLSTVLKVPHTPRLSQMSFLSIPKTITVELTLLDYQYYQIIISKSLDFDIICFCLSPNQHL